MKKLVKIQSISDIITNSSSEVFIMEHSLARSLEHDYNTYCISVEEITYDTLLERLWNYEIYTEMLVKLGIVNYTECKYAGNWQADASNREIFHNILVSHEAEIRKALTDNQYVWVDIEDHFTEWENASDDAHDYCITSESRH